MHTNFNVSISTENTFIQMAIMYALKDMIFVSYPFKFTINDNNYTDKDIIFYESSPGELYICNEKLLNRKSGSLLYVIHNSGLIDSDNEFSKCFRGAIFINIKHQNTDKITTTLSSKLLNYNSKLHESSLVVFSCRNSEFKKMTQTQIKIATYLSDGLDFIQISEKKKVTIGTIKYHIKAIMRTFNLQNIDELYKFIYLLKKRGHIV